MLPAAPAAPTSIDGIVGLIYDAAIDATRWRDVLEMLARHFAGFAVDFIHFDTEDRRFAMHVRYGLDDVAEDLVARFQALVPEDPRFIELNRRYLHRPRAGAWHCRMLVTDDMLRGSRIYREVLRPAGIEYVMASHVCQEGVLTSVSVMRGPDDRVFTEREASEMSRLVPHLQRAVAIQRRLVELDFGARMSLEALDKVPIGLVVVDSTLNALAANAPARRLLDAQDGLIVRERRLIVEDRRVHAELLAAARAVIEDAREGKERVDRFFSIRRARADRHLSIRLGTLWGNHLKFGLPPLAEPLAVLFISDPAEPPRPSTEAIRAFFGLTEAEAQLAAALAAGRTLKAAAADLGRAMETCRSQLKGAFQKTGTVRQADLIRLILSSPSWIDP